VKPRKVYNGMIEDEFEFERAIFKIWRRQSAGNENKVPVLIRITVLCFFASSN
jgi:hypothetical protein